MILKGTITGSIKSTAYDIAGTIKSIYLWNRTNSAAVVNVGIVDEGVDTYFYSSNLAATAATGSSSNLETNVVVKAGWKILVTSSVAIDYYILIE